MITSFKFRALILSVVALIGAAALSANSGGVSISSAGERPVPIRSLSTTAVSTQIISTSLLFTTGDAHDNSS